MLRWVLALAVALCAIASASDDLCSCDTITPCQSLSGGSCSLRNEYGVCPEGSFDCSVEKPIYPKKYRASFNVILPYVNLVENVVAHVDMDEGLQRLSYYNDQDVFIFNKTADVSYEIVPVITTRTCFTAAPQGPSTVFPSLDNFKLKTSTTSVNGQLCNEWFLRQEELDEGTGYIGSYSLFVGVQTGLPVSFAFHGHDTIASGSHFDEYAVDYTEISEVTEFAPRLWLPPASLECSPIYDDDQVGDDDKVGPTVSSSVAPAPSPSSPHHDLHMLHPEGASKRSTLFTRFAADHGKHEEYAQGRLTTMEVAQKQSNFHASLRYINSMNRQRLSYTLGLNHMADWSHEERQRLNGRQKRKTPSSSAKYTHSAPKGVSIPDNVDWRNYGAVSRVKDQGTCGSCWTYGPTGSIEAQHFLKTGKMMELSQQALVDCAWSTGNNACDGGLDSQAYEWIMANKGMPSANAYGPYMSQDGYCHVEKGMEQIKIVGYANTTSGDFDSLNHALATVGPVSISINATPNSFYFYKSGLYDNAECSAKIEDMDHIVLAVGYETVKGKKYTIVKNSWSESWGEEGYVRIAQDGGICGVANMPTFPLL